MFWSAVASSTVSSSASDASVAMASAAPTYQQMHRKPTRPISNNWQHSNAAFKARRHEQQQKQKQKQQRIQEQIQQQEHEKEQQRQNQKQHAATKLDIAFDKGSKLHEQFLGDKRTKLIFYQLV
ncbi:uncharacterized N-acetyltransferase DDB_G0290199 [Drosophila innubila]|uniref:uncharacterized N-acetyltransferase DDB_G0290199 n=1 Tax=Drosophila innubila TaxID=198719 RepID=UPI00148BF005|nr:uncharacterized N-acetyltransferase DDB_G0290199 [Drosophila innubila]